MPLQHHSIRAVRVVPILLLLIVLLIVALVADSDLSSTSYEVPLTGIASLERNGIDQSTVGEANGVFRIILHDRPGRSTGSQLVYSIKELAVYRQWILGTATDGRFLFDASGGDNQLQTFPDAASWRAALAQAAIPVDIPLQPPSAVAAPIAKTLGNRQLHPASYRFMQGCLGASDPQWIGIIVCGALILFFLRGVFAAGHWLDFPAAILIGIVPGGFAFLVLAGGGPDGCGGFFLTPVLCYLSLRAGQWANKPQHATAPARAATA